MIKLTTLTFLGATSLLGVANAATINLGDLGSQTITQSYAVGVIPDDGPTGFGQYTTSDVTFAFTADFGTVSAGGASLFEFGGGGGTGTSLIVRANGTDYEIVFQHENGANQLGGDGSALIALVAPDTENVEIVASLGFTSGTEATLNLFVGGTKIGSFTGLSTDWAGTNDGGFDATGGGSILAANFSNQNFVGASARGITYDTDLKLYSDVFVSEVPEPSSTALLGLGGVALMMRRRL
ncbi:hypothetical protein NT6N_11410 [Oceaniferula spumae]|uniref:Ice-binding protein C-terminal domain-containing protein n=1 Tax=Oceaniferula spumae TaxID=2979115 RepID=A0AAT9FJH3_9BACT